MSRDHGGTDPSAKPRAASHEGSTAAVSAEAQGGHRHHALGGAELDSHYSLLTCYLVASAMAMVGPICQGEGRVAVRMAKAGRSLEDICIAIDAQFG